MLWIPANEQQRQQDRFGQGLAESLAHTSGGMLLHKQRIELAVIATDVLSLDEVAGIAFYDQADAILAMAGEIREPYNAHALLNDTLVGHVAVTINAAAFVAPIPWWRIGLSILIVILSPLIAVAISQATTRGNRSLPIVSVPEPNEEQQSYVLAINPHNLLAIGDRQAVLDDALQMCAEVNALYPGFAFSAASRGCLLLFDRDEVSAAQAVSASCLLQQLLHSYDTPGEFRCYLTQTTVARAPAEATQLSLDDLSEDFDLDEAMTKASLAKPLVLLLSEAIFSELPESEQTWAQRFEHPLVSDEDTLTYHIPELPTAEAERITGQQTVILGF